MKRYARDELLNNKHMTKENKKKNTILCTAFPGTGKSHFYNNSDKIVLDSDSSNFDKKYFPQNYIEHIKKNIGKADIILISSHDVVRNALVKEKLDFVLVFPDISLKDEYLQRYKDRGSDENFIKLLDKNWEGWITELQNREGCKKIILKSGQYISDVM